MPCAVHTPCVTIRNLSSVETARATLLRKIRYSETSLIVTWIDPEHGLFKTMVKGALRPRSNFAGCLDLFYECELTFVRSRSSELHTLREASVLDARETIARHYARTVAATYFIKLFELTLERETPLPEFHDLLSRALGFLQENAPSRRALIHFENQLADLLGLGKEGIPGAAALADSFGKLPPERERIFESHT